MGSLFAQGKQESTQLGDGMFAFFVESLMAVRVEESMDLPVISEGDSVGEESESATQQTGWSESPHFF